MKERPILMSAPMVRAILSGDKTQTRRVIKPQPLWESELYGGPEGDHSIECPYGEPGDQLWVKESFWVVDRPGFLAPHFIYEEEFASYQLGYGDGHWATTRPVGFWESRSCSSKFGHRPSIFMPRAFSRITLEITKVRAERLQEITSNDARFEGIRYAPDSYACEWFAASQRDIRSRRLSDFREVWDAINGKTYPWESNPWVWAITFKRVQS